jgi:signal transduction histidine kinase
VRRPGTDPPGGPDGTGRPAPRGRGLPLRTRLFLLVFASSVVPAALVLGWGWWQLRRQMSLWTLPKVELALGASLQANRRAFDRLLRHMEAEGRILVESSVFPPAPEDTTGLDALIESGCREFGLDLVQFYAVQGSGFRLLASRTPAGRGGPDVAPKLRTPDSSLAGPNRPASLQLDEPRGDILALPTYIWYPAAEGDSLHLRGALVLGVDLGAGYYARIREVSTGLLFYRRLQEIGLVLRTGYGILALLVLLLSLGLSLFLAQRVAGRISRPVDALIRDMDAVGRGSGTGAPEISGIPEMDRLARAFDTMRCTLRAYESRLRESERIRGAQETARFVAHEIRNTLTPIRAGLSVLERQGGREDDEARSRSARALDLIRREADRMTTLAGTFSEYARFPERRPERIDLAALVERLAYEEIPERITLAVERLDEPRAELPAVEADREEMERIFRNLVRNAVEAITGSGAIRLSFAAAETGGLRIVLDDTGRGMDPETLRQAFQPGFTTKGTGTGLGLALVRGAISHYGGTVSLESHPGEGTRCVVELPPATTEEQSR